MVDREGRAVILKSNSRAELLVFNLEEAFSRCLSSFSNELCSQDASKAKGPE